MNYTILNKLALLVKDRTIPFTINFNSNPVKYYGHLIPDVSGEAYSILAQIIFIQILKSKADNNIRYTLFEETINEKIEKLLSLKVSIDFTKTIELLNESIQIINTLNSEYIKYLTIKVKKET